MTYTTEQKNLISALIGTKILPRTKAESLKEALITAHSHMYADTLTETDLLLLDGVLELLVSPSPTDESKEEYRALIEALMVTRAMLAELEPGSE